MRNNLASVGFLLPVSLDCTPTCQITVLSVPLEIGFYDLFVLWTMMNDPVKLPTWMITKNKIFSLV